MAKSYLLALSLIIWLGGPITDWIKSRSIIPRGFFTPGYVETRDIHYVLWYSLIYTLVLIALNYCVRSPGQAARRVVEAAGIARRPLSSRLPITTLALVLLVTTALAYADLLSAESVTRFTGNALFARATIAFAVLLILIAGLSRRRLLYLPMGLALIAGTIYPAVIASRSVTFPFLSLALVFLARGYTFKAVAASYLSIVALAASLVARADSSYVNFWQAFADLLFTVEVVPLVLVNSFPGSDTVSVVYGATQEFSVDNLARFVIYYSPVPSFLIPTSYFEFSSLNYLLQLESDVIGLNADLFSEPLLWFGQSGVVLGPLLLGAMSVLPFYILGRCGLQYSRLLNVLALLVVMYMVAGGMVFSMRAASRFLWYFVILVLLLALGRRAARSKSRRHRTSFDVHYGLAKTATTRVI